MATTKKLPVKKAAAPKTVKKAEGPVWNTVHIFGYGESQVIGKGANGKVANDSLKNIGPLMAHLEGMQEKGTKIGMETLHALSIFNNGFIDFMPKAGKNKPQRFAWSDVDAKQINKLADEIISKIPAPETRKQSTPEFIKHLPAILKKGAAHKKAAPKKIFIKKHPQGKK